MAAIPVILLAFANDREGRFLRSIAEEQRRIRKALSSLVEKKLIHLEELPNATDEDIFDAFRRFKDRIRMFHYGGHAGDLELMLSSGSFSVERFAQYLAKQKGLKLVFMNGCATGSQVRVLQEAGIPEMILTKTSIADEAAQQFSEQFYGHLATGRSIERSFEEASAILQSGVAGKSVSALYRDRLEEDTEILEGLPWELHRYQANEWALPTKAPFPWARMAVIAASFLLVLAGGYNIWRFVLPFDMEVPIVFPEGVKLSNIRMDDKPAQINDKDFFNSNYHELRLHIPGEAYFAPLNSEGLVRFEKIQGQSKPIKLSLQSELWELADTLLHINRRPQPIRLVWNKQLKIIKGRIRGEQGPLSDVSVWLGSKQTKTDMDGLFELEVPDERVDAFSHQLTLEKSGYQTSRPTVNRKDRSPLYSFFLEKTND